MISILPTTDRALIRNFYIKHSLPYGENAAAVIAREHTEVLGYCLFDLYDRSVLVRFLTPETDLLLADGILRSALHVAAEHFAMDARYCETAPGELFKKLGFVPAGQDGILDIDLLFRGCHCEK